MRATKYIKKMVGAGRFELPASWSRTKRATRLRYAPPDIIIGGFNLFGNKDKKGLFGNLSP